MHWVVSSICKSLGSPADTSVRIISFSHHKNPRKGRLGRKHRSCCADGKTEAQHIKGPAVVLPAAQQVLGSTSQQSQARGPSPACQLGTRGHLIPTNVGSPVPILHLRKLRLQWSPTRNPFCLQWASRTPSASEGSLEPGAGHGGGVLWALGNRATGACGARPPHMLFPAGVGARVRPVC